jgi:hypothetical protein
MTYSERPESQSLASAFQILGPARAGARTVESHYREQQLPVGLKTLDRLGLVRGTLRVRRKLVAIGCRNKR